MGSPPQQLFVRLDLSIIAPVSRHYRFNFMILAPTASYFRISITATVARFFSLLPVDLRPRDFWARSLPFSL